MLKSVRKDETDNNSWAESFDDCMSISIEECAKSIHHQVSLLSIYSITRSNERLLGRWSLIKVMDFDMLFGSYLLEALPLIYFLLGPLIS